MEVTIKEKRLVEVTTKSYSLCDKCNNKIETELYEKFECTFILNTGQVYPEGGSGDKQEMELCQTCAPEFIKLLTQNGYRINNSEWDY